MIFITHNRYKSSIYALSVGKYGFNCSAVVQLAISALTFSNPL
jgi:hypothetical protein